MLHLLHQLICEALSDDGEPIDIWTRLSEVGAFFKALKEEGIKSLV